MHKLSEGFNKLITGKINEQAYETRERALMYKDEKKKRDSAKMNREVREAREVREGEDGTRKHQRGPSDVTSLLEEDSAEFISSTPQNEHALANENYL